MALAYCALAVSVCHGLRPMLWSPTWRDVDLTLPVSRRELRASDVEVLLFVQTPMTFVNLVGIVVWLVRNPAWRLDVLLIVLATVLLSTLVSVYWGLAMLQSWRQKGCLSKPGTAPARLTGRAGIPRVSSLSALLLLPLLRYPARRAGTLLVFIPLLALAHGVPLWRANWLQAWLMLYPVLLRLMTTRLHSLLETDLAPLHTLCLPLPLNIRHLLWLRRALALAPL